MAVTHYDLTATFRDAEWTAFDPGSSPVVTWVETNVANTEGIVDEVANQIALGGSRKVADSTGLATWTDLVGSDSDAADINLESGTLQYRVTAEYRNAITRRRERWVSGWFSLTADINLADVISETYVPAAWMTTATATLQTYVDQSEAVRDETQAIRDGIIGDLGTTDSQTATLVNGPSLTSAALLATIATEATPLIDTATDQAKSEAIAIGSALGNDLTKVGIIIDTGGSGAFDEGKVEGLTTVYCPENGRIAGLYVGYNAAVTLASIGLAWTDDGRTWEKAGSIFAGSGGVGDPDRYGVTGPRIIYNDGLYWLFYIGLDAAGYEAGTKRMCVASTPSLVTPVWTRYGAKLSPGGTGWRAAAVYRPSNPIRVNGEWNILINAAGPNNADPALAYLETIGHATAPALDGPWTFNDAVNPVIDNTGGSQITGDPVITKVPGGWRCDFFRAVRNTWTKDYFAVTSDADFPTGWVLGNGGDPILEPSEAYDAKYAGKPDIFRLASRIFHAYTAVSASDHRCLALAVDPPFVAEPDFSTATGVSGSTTAERVTAIERVLQSFGLPLVFTTVVADTFTRADGVPGTTETGAKTYVTGGGAGWAIASNALVWTGVTDGQVGVDSGLADYWEIETPWSAISAGQYTGGLWFGSSATSFVKLYRDQTGNVWSMRDSAVGSPSQVNKTVSTDLVAGDVIKLRKQGTTYTLFVNDLEVAEWTGYTYHNTGADTFQGIIGVGNNGLTVPEWTIKSF